MTNTIFMLVASFTAVAALAVRAPLWFTRPATRLMTIAIAAMAIFAIIRYQPVGDWLENFRPHNLNTLVADMLAVVASYCTWRHVTAGWDMPRTIRVSNYLAVVATVALIVVFFSSAMPDTPTRFPVHLGGLAEVYVVIIASIITISQLAILISTIAYSPQTEDDRIAVVALGLAAVIGLIWGLHRLIYPLLLHDPDAGTGTKYVKLAYPLTALTVIGYSAYALVSYWLRLRRAPAGSR